MNPEHISLGENGEDEELINLETGMPIWDPTESEEEYKARLTPEQLVMFEKQQEEDEAARDAVRAENETEAQAVFDELLPGSDFLERYGSLSAEEQERVREALDELL